MCVGAAIDHHSTLSLNLNTVDLNFVYKVQRGTPHQVANLHIHGYMTLLIVGFDEHLAGR